MYKIWLLFLIFFAQPVFAETDTSAVNFGDTDIRSFAPDSNRYSAVEFATGYHPGQGAMRGLIEFHLPSEPIDSTGITSISLFLYNFGATGNGPYDIHKLNTTFDETTATWNTLSGGTYGSLIDTNSNYNDNTWSEFKLVGTGCAGTCLTGVNWGDDLALILKRQDESGTNYNDWQSKENEDANIRPYLLITYSTPSTPTTTSGNYFLTATPTPTTDSQNLRYIVGIGTMLLIFGIVDLFRRTTAGTTK